MKATIMNKSTRKNIISAVFTVLILAVGIFTSQKLKSQKKSTVSDKIVQKERRTVSYQTFAPSTSTNQINLDGRLQAHERVNITSKVQGLMQQGSKSVREGAYFKKGDVLFTIDNREANFNLKAQKSALMTTITSMMPDLKFDYVESFGAWQSYLSSFDVDRPITTLPTPVNDQEKFFVSGRNIYNQYYTIKGLETRLADYTIYAPFSGVVTAANVFPGALISPGQPLATMINTERYEIASPVPLENLKYIKTGQEVILESEEMGKSWKGKVNRIGTQIDPNTQNLPVYISVYGRGLKDGMYLKGRLNGAPLSDVTALPKDIFVSPTSIYVIQDSTLVLKEITSIKRSDSEVIVRGLGADERVVTGSLAGLFEGQKVNY